MAFEARRVFGHGAAWASVSDRPGTLRLLLDAARSESLGFLAAAIAYYAFVSLVPLSILALAGASVLGGEALGRTVADALGGVLTPEAAALVSQALVSGAGREGATVLGVLVLLWSGLRLLRGLDVAFGRIYGNETAPSLPGQLRDAGATLGATAVAIALVAIILAVVEATGLPVEGLLGPLSLVLLPVVFYPLYYVLPNVDIRPHEAVPGAVLAGVGWTVMGWAFALYAGYVAATSVYGAVGTVLLALAWFYAGALVVLLGAVLNAVGAERVDNRQLQQVAGRESD